MKNNKGFATSFMLFSLLALFLVVVIMLLLTMNNSSSISGRMKDAIKDKAENSKNNRQTSDNTDYMQDNLVLYYDALDHGNDNTTWDDLSGNGNDGVITGGEFKNGSLYLSGSGTGVVSTNGIDYNNNMTFEITLFSNVSGDSEVLDARANANTGYQPLYIRYSDHYGEIFSTTGGGYYQDMKYLKENIHTLSIIYTPSGVTVYKNGAKVSTNTTPKGMTYNANLFIGRYALANSHNFKGNIYSVRVYDKALDVNEIRKNYEYDAKRYTLPKDNEYTGSVQTFTAPATGNYKIEAWGAQGGTANRGIGGKGAYTSGSINLNKGQKLYLYIGENVNTDRETLTFNGGGSGSHSTNGQDINGNGGGATDIRLVSGDWDNEASLASRIMVAGGGGGAFDARAGTNYYANGGDAGGLTSLDGNYVKWGSTAQVLSTGATQTQGGKGAAANEKDGTFGIGGYGSYTGTWIYYSGGGGGYYGGGSGGALSSVVMTASGGSSYISGHTGCVAIQSQDNITPKNGCTDGTTDITCSYHYSNKIFTNTIMKAGNEEMPTLNGKGSMTGNSGNGYVKITVLGSN